MISAIPALFRRKPTDASTKLDIIAAGVRLAEAIRTREAFLAAEGRTTELARTRVAHRELEAVASSHAGRLGFDIAPLSGGTPKEMP